MEDKHMKAAHAVCIEAEAFQKETSLLDFEAVMDAREGYVVVHQGNVVGVISFSDYTPGIDIRIHASVLPKYHARWITKTIAKTVFEYPFVHLGLQRLSAISFKGVTDSVGAFLEHLGFTLEGCIRKAANINNEPTDINLYGMLREECKWL